LKFSAECDAKFKCTVSIVDSGFFSDTAIAKITFPLTMLTANKEQQTLKLQLPNGGAPIELDVRAVWKGRGGPRTEGQPWLPRIISLGQSVRHLHEHPH